MLWPVLGPSVITLVSSFIRVVVLLYIALIRNSLGSLMVTPELLYPPVLCYLVLHELLGGPWVVTTVVTVAGSRP